MLVRRQRPIEPSLRVAEAPMASNHAMIRVTTMASTLSEGPIRAQVNAPFLISDVLAVFLRAVQGWYKIKVKDLYWNCAVCYRITKMTDWTSIRKSNKATLTCKAGRFHLSRNLVPA